MSLSAGCFTVIRGGNLSYYITLALLFVSGKLTIYGVYTPKHSASETSVKETDFE